MRARSFLAAILSAGVLAAPARATTVTTNLFAEEFSTATGHWSASSGFKSDRTWTKDGSVFGALGGAKLGTGTKVGSITSELIPLRVADTTAALAIYVQAAAYSNQTGKLLLSAVDENGDTLHSWTTNLVAADVATATDLSNMESAAAFDLTFDFTTAVPFKLVLTTGNSSGSSDKRVLVGAVRVSETYEEVDDPWAPVWTVGTPTPAPRVGTAFSFGVSAVLADDTPQAVTFGGLTPAAAGAQPTFENGLFSWTPGENAAGIYVAAFSVENTGGSYGTNVTFTVRGATEENELFWEDFPKYDYSWTYTGGPVTFPTTDTRKPGWTGSLCYIARSAIRLGKTSDYGSASTPAIETANGAPATVTLTLDAAAYAEKTGTLGITAADADTSAVLLSTNVILTAMANTSVADLSAYPIGPIRFAAAGRFKITFTPVSGDGRMGIDSVKVTQTVSTSLVDLDVPAGLALDGGSLSTNSFSVLWTAVSNATAYTVALYDATDADPFFTTNLAETAVSFSGLADDADYRVRVRAEGDTSLFNYSDWSSFLSVRTARSPEHPTLSFGGWVNAVGDGGLYAGVANTAAVSAVRDDGTNAVVTLESVSPAPAVGPALEDGVLFWTPVDADTNKTFTVSFLMDGTYATNLSFKVKGLAPLAPPTVAATNVLWNSFGLSWNAQYRAAGYAVRVWTDCPSPSATATRVEETFANWPTVKPAGWSYHTLSGGYKDAAAPVMFDGSADTMETYDLGGPISSVSFHAAGHSISNSTSALTVFGIAADGTETVLATLTYADIGQTATGIDRTYSVPAGVRRIAWRYTKDKGGVGVGSVVIEGTGFSTPRWLPGWGPAAKNVGLVQGCTVAKPRPGKVLGVDPSDPRKDLAEPRVHYAEVAARDVAGAAFASVVEVDVPAPPRSVRATMMILR